jgi:hypothetical protein
MIKESLNQGKANPMNFLRKNRNFWKSERTLGSEIWEIKLHQRLRITKA